LKTGGAVSGWHDEGFNPLFKDPWPSSDNQVGHFLTAVNLGADPNFVGKKSNLLGFLSQMSQMNPGPETVRDYLWAPASLSNTEVSIRLIVGHEKEADSKNPLNFITQFDAATSEDVQVFKKAEEALGSGAKLNLDAALKVLKGDENNKGITVDSSKEGNSYQDLLLSLVGWRLGQDIASGKINDRKEVATWIRTNLK
jgi:hypothetical protein